MDDFETSVRETIAFLPRVTGEQTTSDLQDPPLAQRKPWRRFWRN
jgi:hypothetical protein